MTYRELFHEIMFYGEFDRMPVIHWAGWPETVERWEKEGMPKGVNQAQYFDAVRQWAGVGLGVGRWPNELLYPAFDEETLEETEEYRIRREAGGVIQKEWKHASCIPQFVSFTLQGAKDWPEYKKRLQPDPARIPADLDDHLRRVEELGWPIAISTGSLMGYIRNWMGVENMSYLMYDDRDCYADMVNTLADLVCWNIDQIVPPMRVLPSLGHGWEDICGKAGPLVSPHIFDECVAPGYSKIRTKLEEYGIKLLGIDSDGDVSLLVGHWLDAGVNVQFPVQVGTWKGDAPNLRKIYGKELRVVGNFDKLTLEQSHQAVEAEIERLLPLMKEGGFVMMPDHLITPGVALNDYKWYLDRVRELRF